jgi:hypothetical protein
MINLVKQQNGFSFKNLNYTFDTTKEEEILSSTTCHIPTIEAVLFFDTTVTINGQTFSNIQDWITELYLDVE